MMTTPASAFLVFCRYILTSLVCGMLVCGIAWAGEADGLSSDDSSSNVVLSGEAVYRHYCMACHMADGQGAQAAGYFPALADNRSLTAAGYPIYVILNGQGAMPWFNGLLSDEEIAAVVTYIRTRFGNHYPEVVKAEDVALMRGPVPKE